MMSSTLILPVFCNFILLCISASVAAQNDTETLPAVLLGQRAALLIKNRLLRRQERVQLRSREICYDMVGCFPMPRTQISPLKKPPQSPETVDTKFLLVTRASLASNTSQLLKYGDTQRSLIEARFDSNLPTKLIIHGFKGSGQDRGALEITTAVLQLENANVVLVDWQKGAAGPSYISAASNTQLVGRQVALLLMDMIVKGLDPSTLHIIGFSLGAHIAGYAGRAIQKKQLKVGRITGLDPASPLFRELLSTSLSPLHKNDAKFVDIIHTDGARFLAEGLGIFRPIGHVDYFPNGGFDQPGCNHVRGAVLASHLGGSLNTSVVCNHLRAWQLFLESLHSADTGCEFMSYPCPGGWSSFEKGHCFASQCSDQSCNRMGYSSHQPTTNSGPLFLVTRDTPPYCGEQLHVTVILSSNIMSVRGDMQVSILAEQEVTHFKLHSEYVHFNLSISRLWSKLEGYSPKCSFSSLYANENEGEGDGEPPANKTKVRFYRDELQGGFVLRGIGAVPIDMVSAEKNSSINVHISCHIINSPQKTNVKRNIRVIQPPIMAVDEVSIRDLRGHSWRYFGPNTALSNVNGSSVEAVTLDLRLQSTLT